jgi:hypothetical protein
MDEYWEPGQPLDGPERWYPVTDFEGVYEVSTYGNIRRIVGGAGTKVKNGVPHIIKTHPNSKGYWLANLWRGGKRATIKVHKIVARAFHGPPPVDIAGDAEVHHVDNNKDNNRADNMEYRSAYDNMMEMQARYWKTGQWKG